MKKFTSLMMLLLFAVTTWGQMLEVGKVYQLQSGRDASTVMNMTSGNETRTATKAENDYSQYWAVEEGATEGTYALYNLNFKKYIKPYQGTNTTWKVSETKTEETNLYISVENEETGVISIRYSETSAAGTHNGAHHEGWYGGIVSWEATSDASQWTPIYIGTIDEINGTIAEEATALEDKKTIAQEILTASGLSTTSTKIDLQVEDENAAGYLWANTYADGDEGVIDYLIDGDNNTFFHTSWSNYATDGSKDYVEIDLGTGNTVESISFDYVTRHNGNTDFPTSITLLGSNDKNTYEEIGSVNSGLPNGNTKSYTSPVFNNGKSYRYIRFQVNSTTRANASIPYFHLAELNFYKVETVINEEYKEYITELSALETALNACTTTTPNDVNSSSATLANAIDAYYDANREVTLTYNLYFNDELIETQNVVGLVGDAFPQPNLNSSWSYVVASNIPEGNVEGAGEHDITLTISGRPFNAADSYASIANWYYLKFDSNNSFYLHHDADQNYIDLNSKAVDASNKDIYTWAFVGNPFEGYKIVNKATGEGYILSSSTTMAGTTGADTWPIMTEEATLPEGNNTYWIATSSTHTTNGFYLAQKDFPSNRMNNRGKLAYWTDGAGTGSTFWVEERDMSGATELQALIDAIKAKSYEEGTTVGYIKSLAALNEAIASAEQAVENKTACDEAQAALQAAEDALETIQPEDGKFYNIVSSCTVDTRAGQKIYVNNAGEMQFQDAATMGEVFQFVDAGDNKFYLYNVERGTYLNTAKGHGGGQHTALVTTTDNAVKVTITNMCKENVVKIVPDGGAMIHAQESGSKVAGWNNTSNTEASAWKIEEVDVTTLAHSVTVSDAGYATLYLNYAVTIPEGVNVYGVTEATNGWAIMDEITGTIPAKTGVILENVGEFAFYYSNNVGEGTSILKGTLLDENRTEDAYVLGIADEKVGMYLAAKNQAENTAFKNNAFKAYLVPEVKENIASYSFNFDWNGTTGIENIEDAVEENATKAIYDITGRQIKAITVPGIYIINGKKTFVK